MKPLAWALVSLGLLVLAPAQIHAQNSQQGARVELGRNYPNPFNPETTIPFTLSQDFFAGGKEPVVSLRIYNVLAQLTAVPILQGSGAPMENLQLAWNGTGQYSAYWDGTVLNTGRPASSGVYVYQLVVNGHAYPPMKMTIVK
jgi:hypothetical protein